MTLMTVMQMRWISEILGRWDEPNVRGVEKVENSHTEYFLVLGSMSQLARPGLRSELGRSLPGSTYKTPPSYKAPFKIKKSHQPLYKTRVYTL